MKQYSRYVAKTLKCPECGAENRIRFGDSQMLIEGACERCNAEVRWKRTITRGAVATFFDE